MRRLLLSAIFCLLASITIKADPFTILPNGELVFNTSFSTSGFFTCTPCTGSGTNSVVFGSGGNTVTLTFTGTSNTVQVGSSKVNVNLGQIQVTATGSGFVFPTGANPNVPMLTFNISIPTTSPTVSATGNGWAAFGGGTSLQMFPFPNDHSILIPPPQPPGFNYTFIVFTYLPFTIPNTNGVVNVNADVSAVPEPTSVLLLTSGAGMMLGLWRKRFSKR